MRKTICATLLAAALLAGCAAPTRIQREREAIDAYVAGQLHLDDADENAALLALIKAIEADPQLASAHAALGDIYRKRGDNRSAVNAYERAVTSNAFNFRNHYNCGTLHQILADPADAAAEAVARHLRRAVELYRRAIMLNAGDYDARLNLGLCHYRLGQYEPATRYFSEAIELNDQLPHAYTNMGAVYDRLGKNLDAITMYNKSLERDSRQPEVLVNLAAIYIRQEKWKSAIRSYSQALELDPNSADALHGLGHCYYFLKDYAKAVESFKAALALDARRAVTHRALGVAYLAQYLANRDDLALRAKAVEHWRISLSLNPNQPDLAPLINRYSAD